MRKEVLRLILLSSVNDASVGLIGFWKDVRLAQGNMDLFDSYALAGAWEVTILLWE